MNRRAVGRWLVSASVLALLVVWLNPLAVLEQMAGLSAPWLAAALLVSVAQTVLSAWRWRFTARRLGVGLGWTPALADYYLALFVNQVMPGGVAGDALRAHRHARASGAMGPAWRAVIIERASGQFVAFVVVAALFVFDPLWRRILGGVVTGDATGWVWVVILLAACAGLMTGLVRRWPEQWTAFRSDVYCALLARPAWLRQLGASVLIVGSYALVFALAARGVGVDLDLLRLAAVAPPILLAMLIPVSVAGWGFREVFASAVWVALGLPAEQGAAVGIAYGLIMLAAALPGGVVLAVRPDRAPAR
jgi:uncharacterized membrane protein YbhN (UPF0104 family)